MTRCLFSDFRKFSAICGLLISAAVPGGASEQPAPADLAAFSSYIQKVEARLAQQHESEAAFLAPSSSMRLLPGQLIVEQLTPSTGAVLPGALLHHWRGTAFAPGAKAGDFERLLRNIDDYPQDFSPEVLQARVLSQAGDRVQAWMRVRQRHVITVVMDTTYDITFGRLDAQRGYSLSRSTRISEVGPNGRVLNSNEEHGFLWRLNTYWSYEEKDGGLYIQIESVSFTRSIPAGLGWVIEPFVESIPRESLEFTLRSACTALGNRQVEAQK